MLRDSLFVVRSQKLSAQTAEFMVSFCPDHTIYKAHFPSQPITPGVCLIQMVKELMQDVLHRTLLLVNAKNVKFISVVIPDAYSPVSVHCEWTIDQDAREMHVTVVVADEKKIYVKMSLYFNFLSLCVLIPVYNNEHTIASVVADAKRFCSNIIVVNDGSNDNTMNELNKFIDSITLIDYSSNKGKGYALRKGFERARELCFDYVLTMDADGQHLAEDIPALSTAALRYPNAMIVGSRQFDVENMPSKNVKANRFSNFWFTFQTCSHLPDTQTGYRIYPLKRMKNLNPLWKRYEAELDLLVRSAWRGIPLISVPVNVYYPPENERVSHFRPARDFLRISLLNTGLCFAAFFYGLPRILFTRLFAHHA